jgi:hypothetical protein
MAHTRLLQAKRRIGPLVVTMALLGLPGCGGIDGVDFNGKIFDAVGLTGALGKREEPKTEPRAPLVLPPSGEQLRAPGELAAAPVQQADAAWPVDPDKTKAQKESAKKQAQAEYCRDGNWKEKAMKDEIGAAQGPAGNCASIFSVLSKTLFGGD